MVEYIVLILDGILIAVPLIDRILHLRLGTSDVVNADLQKGTASPNKVIFGAIFDIFAWLIVAAAFGLSFYIILAGRSGPDDQKFAYGTIGMCLGIAVGRLKK